MTCPTCGADQKLTVKIYGVNQPVVGHQEPLPGAIVVCLSCGQGARMESGGPISLLAEDVDELDEDQRAVLERVKSSVAKMHRDIGKPKA